MLTTDMVSCIIFASNNHFNSLMDTQNKRLKMLVLGEELLNRYFYIQMQIEINHTLFHYLFACIGFNKL